MPAYYTDVYRRKAKPDASLGDDDFWKKLVDKCLVDGEIRLKGEVNYYDMCEQHYVCVVD